ncbi:MAG: hypothetical protein WC227_01005 [Patescibacteria group bacterium]|jgi:hypothetical protein
MELDTIRKRIEQLAKLKEEIKIQKELLKGELENEEEYLKVAEEAKAANQKKKIIRDEILGRGPNQETLAKIKDDNEEISTLKEILSAELVQIFHENNTDEIAGQKIKVIGTLVPNAKQYDKKNFSGSYGE